MWPSAKSLFMTAPQWKHASPWIRARLTPFETLLGLGRVRSFIPVPICRFMYVRQIVEAGKGAKYPTEGYPGGTQVAAHHSAKFVSISALARFRRRRVATSSRTHGCSRVC